MTESSKLPPEEEDHVIEISLKHVILSFGGLLFGVALVGSSIILVKDYTKYKRQKAIIDATTQLLMKLQNTERREDWKKEKKKTAIPSSSQTGT